MKPGITLDYAGPEGVKWREWMLANMPGMGVLAVWWLVYAVACGPAIGQRGFPPLGAHVQGMTMLWMVGVPLSALVQRFSKGRVVTLLVYGFASGFIDAASWPMLVPNFFNPVATAGMTLIIYGPVHVMVSGVLEVICRLAGWVVAKAGVGRIGMQVVRGVAGVVLLVGAFYVPTIYAAYDGWSLERQGRRMAEEDWRQRECQLNTESSCTSEPVPGIEESIYIDLETGMLFNPYYHRAFRRGYEEAYNQRVRELVKENGRPSWAAPRLPGEAELARRLDGDDFTEVAKFPLDVNGNITVFHGGVMRWGKAHLSNKDVLSVTTKMDGVLYIGKVVKTTYMRRDAAYPGLVFIRDGKEWMGVFDEEGRYLAEVRRR